MLKTLKPLVLASGSPRRKSLLKALGIEFQVDPSGIVESGAIAESVDTPAETAGRFARMKAESTSVRHPYAWVLGADTIVVLDGRIFGKPSDRSDAVRMLGELSGRQHEVITALCLFGPGSELHRSDSVVSKVLFRELSEREIEDYVETSEPMDKAGAYGIQGIGATLVSSVVGSYTNVVGLPLCRTIEWLVEEKIIEPA